MLSLVYLDRMTAVETCLCRQTAKIRRSMSSRASRVTNETDDNGTGTGNSNSDNEMIQRLMNKVKEQAQELSFLYSELSESKQIISTYEKKTTKLPPRPSSSSTITASQETHSSITTSKEAQKKRIEKEHKEQLLSLERQLATQQHRYDELMKYKNQLVVENEKLSREMKFHEKCASDSQQELQKLRTQLEIIHHKHNTHNTHTHSNSNGNGNGNEDENKRNLFQEIKFIKNNFQEIENQNSEMKLKIKVLEDALEFRVNEIGLSGHADLLTKLSYLKGEISAMKKDLLKKNSLVENLENEKFLIQSEAQTLQQQLTLVQQNLMETKHDLNRSKQLLNISLPYSGEQHSTSSPSSSVPREGEESSPPHVINALDQIKSLEQERDLLIEFIQTDLQKSSSLQTELNEIKFQTKAMSEEKERLERQLVTVTEKLTVKSAKYEDLSKDFVQIESELKSVERERNEFRVIAQKREEEIQELYETNSKISSQVPLPFPTFL